MSTRNKKRKRVERAYTRRFVMRLDQKILLGGSVTVTDATGLSIGTWTSTPPISAPPYFITNGSSMTFTACPASEETMNKGKTGNEKDCKRCTLSALCLPIGVAEAAKEFWCCSSCGNIHRRREDGTDSKEIPLSNEVCDELWTWLNKTVRCRRCIRLRELEERRRNSEKLRQRKERYKR